jgi:RNA polymerase sigma factor (sigma-70 family)
MKLDRVVDELLACYGELRAHLRGRLRNADDVADVAQATFMQVYAHALAAPVDSPRALLYRTAHNLCIDRHRRAGTEAAALQTWTLLQPEDAPCTERAAAARQALAQVAARLMRLPRLRREVFVLVRVYGHTHAEVCTQLGLSREAVEKHIVRATLDLTSLAQALECASNAGTTGGKGAGASGVEPAWAP